MQLSECADLCDSIELAALVKGRPFSKQQILRQFFPASKDPKDENLIREAMQLAIRRKRACGEATYPFTVEARNIQAKPLEAFNIYHFLLFGRMLILGGPANAEDLRRKFRRYFEDIVCWSLRKAGFTAEILSIPREPRGLHLKLVNSLDLIKDRFGECATIKAEAISSDDNDLDVDVLAVVCPGNGECGGWPIFLIQCATGAITTLQSKIGEGKDTFSSVWEGGFFPSHSIRGCATPDCLLALHNRDWTRLSLAGWVLDRTRIAHLASFGKELPLPADVNAFWLELAAASPDIDWQTGWQSELAGEAVIT